MGENPQITVGIVTRNRLAGLKAAIRSVYAQNFPDLEIVVADNASEEGILELAEAEFPEVRFLRLEENRGCPGGRNQIYRHARGEIIVNLDDDGELGEGALERLVEAFAADPAIGVVAARMLEPQSPLPRTGPARPWDTGLFWGGVSAFRRTMLEEIGLYPEDFFFFKEEEYLALKALDAGWRIVYHPGVIIHHPRIKHRAGEDIRRDYYLFRNPLFVVIELFPGISLGKYLFLRTVSYSLISLKRGSFAAYCRALGAVPGKLAGTLGRRRPVSASTLRRYFALRGNLPAPEGETPAARR